MLLEKSDDISDVVTVSISWGANVQAVNDHLRSPLHDAAIFGNVKVTEALLRAGATDTIRDKGGRLAVNSAFYGQHMSVARVFARSGVDVQQRDSRGKTAADVARGPGVRLDMSWRIAILRKHRPKTTDSLSGNAS